MKMGRSKQTCSVCINDFQQGYSSSTQVSPLSTRLDHQKIALRTYFPQLMCQGLVKGEQKVSPMQIGLRTLFPITGVGTLKATLMIPSHHNNKKVWISTLSFQRSHLKNNIYKIILTFSSSFEDWKGS